MCRRVRAKALQEVTASLAHPPQRYFGTAVGKGRQAAKTEIERLKLAEIGCDQGVAEVAKMCAANPVSSLGMHPAHHAQPWKLCSSQEAPTKALQRGETAAEGVLRSCVCRGPPQPVQRA